MSKNKKKIEKKEIIKVKPIIEPTKNLNSIFLIIAFLIAIFLFNYYNPIKVDYNYNNTQTILSNLNQDNSSNEIKSFSSKEELIKFIKKQNTNQNNNYNTYNINKNIKLSGSSMAKVEPLDSISETTSTANSAEDYSTTNNQVNGVDEPDIVKNDGKYIYTISQNKLIILNAYPAKELKILSTIKFKDNTRISNIFLNKDKLVIFTNSYETQIKVSQYNFLPEETRITKTYANIYNISNKEKPKLIKNISVTGNYFDARMINSYIYFITKEYSNYINNDFKTPKIFDSNKKIINPKIYYFDIPYNSYTFHTITSFDLNNLEKDIQVKTFLLPNSNNLYVSKNNIYITYNKYYNYDNLKVFKTIVLNQFPTQIQNKILNTNTTFEITNILETYYNSISKTKKKELLENIKKIEEEEYNKFISKSQKTIIHKININNGEINYNTKSEINGHLLNQFSLDENKKGELRLATTTSYWEKDNRKIQYNNVYILDKNLNELSKLKNIAKNEKIYSTRFIKNKLYLVTFKQIDPLFVIDLSDSKNPKILGKLKIPGYSTYLHPYDNTHLIGLGYNTKETKSKRIINDGIKISLFDISNFQNPVEVDNYIIKGKYTNSIATRDHKSFLFDKDKNLLVIPIREYLDKNKNNNYNFNFKQSAFVFNINKTKIKYSGKITHEENESENSYWYNSPSSIKRSLFMDNTLYTISDKKIISNDIKTLNKLKEIKLGYTKPKYNYPERYY